MKVPAHSMITIPPSWPFTCWGLYMIGPLAMTLGGFTYVLVVINEFSKWIENKPVTTQSADKVYQFGFPNTIITDLGSNYQTRGSGTAHRHRIFLSKG